MFKPTANSRALWQGLALACAIAGSAATATPAFAGECPAGKMKADAREEVKFKPVGVTDVTLGAIDLEKQPAHLRDREDCVCPRSTGADDDRQPHLPRRRRRAPPHAVD